MHALHLGKSQSAAAASANTFYAPILSFHLCAYARCSQQNNVLIKNVIACKQELLVCNLCVMCGHRALKRMDWGWGALLQGRHARRHLALLPLAPTLRPKTCSKGGGAAGLPAAAAAEPGQRLHAWGTARWCWRCPGCLPSRPCAAGWSRSAQSRPPTCRCACGDSRHGMGSGSKAEPRGGWWGWVVVWWGGRAAATRTRFGHQQHLPESAEGWTPPHAVRTGAHASLLRRPPALYARLKLVLPPDVGWQVGVARLRAREARAGEATNRRCSEVGNSGPAGSWVPTHKT